MGALSIMGHSGTPKLGQLECFTDLILNLWRREDQMMFPLRFLWSPEQRFFLFISFCSSTFMFMSFPVYVLFWKRK